MKPIRLSVKALIIREGRLLAVRARDAEGDWYMLPGGGQHSGETVPDALRRECLEEVGADITVGRLRFVRDYIARNHEFAKADADTHQVELIFECDVTSEPKMGAAPDTSQTGVEWLELEALAEYRIYPSVLQQLLRVQTGNSEAVYLGDVN